MIYNLVLVSRYTGNIIEKEVGFDKRPLRFINKAHADREAHEKNAILAEDIRDMPIYWKVVEDKDV